MTTTWCPFGSREHSNYDEDQAANKPGNLIDAIFDSCGPPLLHIAGAKEYLGKLGAVGSKVSRPN